jgi:hypothetical protein
MFFFFWKGEFQGGRRPVGGNDITVLFHRFRGIKRSAGDEKSFLSGKNRCLAPFKHSGIG